ncbi:MAG: formate dehydrogenase accessory sulfurtransferase FdhD, partial [Synergistaceae bacterium]|nr:formate dehydrogenase accessory sulfurtransferase FdhD [Synergistaceae bacterium]
LITSGRLPEDMVLKGAGARIPVMASISAATANGADAARRCNMTLIGFARNGRFNVYSAPERIKFNSEEKISEGEKIA